MTATAQRRFSVGGALGAELAARSDGDLLTGLRRDYDELSRVQARVLGAIAELAAREPTLGDGGRRDACQYPLAVHEIAAELAWTTRAVENELDFAVEIMARHPQLGAALADGRIDRRRAWVVAQYCADLTTAQAADLLAELLPKARMATSAQLGERARRLAISLDPQFAQRRYQRAIKQRRVSAWLTPEGTATLSGSNLAPEHVQAASRALHELAKAIRRAGHPETVQYIEAELYLALLDGRLTGLTREQIITVMVRAGQEAADADTDARRAETAAAKAAAAQPSDPDVPSVPTVLPVPTVPTEPPVPTAPSVRQAAAPLSALGADLSGAAMTAIGRPAGVELRVELATLLGGNDHPAELPGMGPILAGNARAAAARQHTAQWRWAVLDDTGHLLSDGITRYRPAGHATSAQATGGIVELLIPLSTLSSLHLNDHPAWARLITDIRGQHASWRPPFQDPAARLPSAALRRHLELKWRYCTVPTCRTSAARGEIDHAHEWAKAGPTAETNLQPPCATHHGLHTKKLWSVFLDATGNAGHWRTYRGRIHHFHIKPLLDKLLPPRPRLADPKTDDPKTDDPETDDPDTGQRPLEPLDLPPPPAAPDEAAPDEPAPDEPEQADEPPPF